MIQMRAYDFIKNLMEEEYFHGQWFMVWDQTESYFELVLQCPLANEEGYHLEDNHQGESVEPEIFYQFSVVFYNPREIELDKAGALMAFPIDWDKGIRQGDALAIVRYLKILSASVRIAWYNFLKEDKANQTFSLEWNAQEFEALRQQLKDKQLFSDHRLLFKEE
ncbi:DUF3013 family protein [Ignavigranum ruoffiae]|uniref:Uncharacterized protein n=1 Tax=Ignavigranum ruoffiae TaxID=89093 RepID=A0A1H8ZZB8_9LACT|nr:DUF3013 family protein [Ignavigranum ruoffiae]UPQ85689.1 DUF3013 family protein [Ignavigranum ruoffiae]SEP69611.1 Protein of unknown function [Ignavigranum ruoffiae]